MGGARVEPSFQGLGQGEITSELAIAANLKDSEARASRTFDGEFLPETTQRVQLR